MGPFIEYSPAVWPAPSMGRERALAPNATLAMVLFIATEVMFFAGLISAYLVLRSGFEIWPPAGQPRLPVGVTALNSIVLLSSGAAMLGARRRAEQGRFSEAAGVLRLAWLLGGVFLAVQGVEWLRLLNFGLKAAGSVYGGTFCLLIGAHALHVLGGLSLLVWVWRRGQGAVERRKKIQDYRLATLYWVFVVSLWPVLYVLVYF